MRKFELKQFRFNKLNIISKRFCYQLEKDETMQNYKTLIESNHKIMLGKPVIKGTRITVELILRKLSEGASISDILENYPHLNYEQINACFEYAADLLENEEVLDLV